MSGFFFTATLVSMFIVLAILITGIAAMSKGGAFNEKYGNKLMRARVIMQGVTLGLFALTILTSGK